jgi:hypothetical protein
LSSRRAAAEDPHLQISAAHVAHSHASAQLTASVMAHMQGTPPPPSSFKHCLHDQDITVFPERMFTVNNGRTVYITTTS